MADSFMPFPIFFFHGLREKYFTFIWNMGDSKDKFVHHFELLPIARNDFRSREENVCE